MYAKLQYAYLFFFSSRRRHTRYWRDWSSDVCSSDLGPGAAPAGLGEHGGEPGAGAQGHGGEGAAGGGARGGGVVPAAQGPGGGAADRSGERRGGEEGRSRGAPDH